MLTAAMAKRPLRSLSDLIDRRVEEVIRESQDERALLLREVEDLRSRVRALHLLLDGAGRGTARTPSWADLGKLEGEITLVAGVSREVAQRNVHSAFRLLVALESLGVGRIAGSTMNVCGKLATIPLLDAPNDDVLEIGTLYGLFAAGMLRMLERVGRSPQLTVVDPLIGNQLQPGATMHADASGTPVDEKAVRTNLSLAGTAGNAARVQVGFSTDPAVRAAAGDRKYGLLVIDGDHSYEGVRADLEWAEELVAPGGLIVLDDYGDRKWHGVQKALDEHLTGSTRMTLLGRVATSGYVRAT